MPIFSAKPRTWDAYLAGGGGGGDIALQTTATPAPAAPALNLVKLLGPRQATSRQGIRAGGTGGTGLDQGESGGSPGEINALPGSGGGQQDPEPPSSPQPRNAVSRVLSGVGNTVESDTESLGNSLGGSSSPGLGGVLGGVGRTLNSDLQSLAGNH
jgi:hypothetical protein